MNDMVALAPARSVNLREIVYQQLRNAFMAGAFAPGDALNLRDLADRFQTSMTPVREAVRRLVAEGALTDAPGRALRVPPVDLDRVVDIKRTRLALETLATELAVPRMSPADIRRLDGMLSAAEGRGATSAADDLHFNREFHFGLYRHSGSPTLLSLIEILWLQYGPVLNLVLNKADPTARGSHADHRRILDAMRSGDVAGAKAALTDDVSRPFDLLEAYLKSG